MEEWEEMLAWLNKLLLQQELFKDLEHLEVIVEIKEEVVIQEMETTIQEEVEIQEMEDQTQEETQEMEEEIQEEEIMVQEWLFKQQIDSELELLEEVQD